MNKPISMWGYFGYQILFALPVVGWIFALVLALAARNVNVRNFARSYFCVLILVIILAVVGVAAGGITALSLLFSPSTTLIP